MMDRGRPSKHEHAPSSTSTTSIGSVPSISRLRPGIVSNFDTVRRKPVPSSASPASSRATPPLSSSGIVVAGGEDVHANRQSFLEDPPSLSQPLSGSPTLVARDLDQYMPLLIRDLHHADHSLSQVPSRPLSSHQPTSSERYIPCYHYGEQYSSSPTTSVAASQRVKTP